MASANIAELPEITDTIYFIIAMARLPVRANTTAYRELLSDFMPEM
jgi:hypothetical protein